MTPKRPYLLRAMFDWVEDNNETPHIAVDTTVGGCQIPEEYVNDEGRIVLNVSKTATWNLVLADTYVSFGARFNKTPHEIKVPIGAVTAIYSKESGAGLLLGEATPPEKSEPEETDTKTPPYLRLVVNNDDES